MSRSLLHRYWLQFEPPVADSPLGVGVTAYSLDDALDLLARDLSFDERPEPRAVVEDVAASDLDQGHVVPNMHPITERGVWFPILSVNR